MAYITRDGHRQVPISARIDHHVKVALDRWCSNHKIARNRFINRAIASYLNQLGNDEIAYL